MGLFSRRDDDGDYQMRGNQYNNSYNSNADNNYNSNNIGQHNHHGTGNMPNTYDNTNTNGPGIMGHHGRRNDDYNSNTGAGVMGRHEGRNDGYNNTPGAGITGHHDRTNDGYNNSRSGIIGHQDRRNDGYDNSGVMRNNGNLNDGYNNHDGGGRMGSSRNYGRHGDDYNNNDNRMDSHGRNHHKQKKGFVFFQKHKEKKQMKKREKRQLFDMDSGYYNRQPSFGQWLKFTWIDLITMAILGAIGLGVYRAHPAPTRSFPVTFIDGSVVYPQFGYPIRHEIIPIWAAALLASLIPLFIILCMQIRIRSFWDVNNAVVGLLYSLITAAVFQVFLKWLIGGLRPHFLDACDPDPALVALGGNGFNSMMFDRSVCRGERNTIDDSLESFPSGHSTAAFAGFMYLYFYLNAKLKVFSNHHPAMWKLVALYAPVLGATLIAGTLTIDEFHNWYDCLAGAIIGSVMAISAYRMTYASVWDFRFNHIPLTRHTPFSYGAGEAGAGGFESAVFTRKAGWGFEEAYGGAPFDAAHGLRGQLAGFNQGAPGRHGGAGIKGDKLNDVEHNAVGTTTSRDHGHLQNGRNDYDNDTAFDNTRNKTTTHHNEKGGGGLGGLLHGRKHHDDQTAVTSTNPMNNARNDGNVVTNNRDSTGNYANEQNVNRNSRHLADEPRSNRGDIYSDSNQPTSQALASTRDNAFNEPRTSTRDGRYQQHSRSTERKAIPQQNTVVT